MQIGIDGNEANINQKVGIGEYAFKIITGIYNYVSKADLKDLRFKIFLKEKPRNDFVKNNAWWEYVVVKPKTVWTQFGLPLNLYFFNRQINIFFSPTHYAPRFTNIKTVISIMDLSFLRFPDLFKKKDLYQLVNWTRYSVNNASLIFTISEFSKSEIMKYYGIAEEKIIVTYPGYDDKNYKRLFSNDDIKIKSNFSNLGRFILFVGTIQPRKNISNLVKTFDLLKNKHKDLKLVIVGKKGWLYEGIFKNIKSSIYSKDIIILDYVDKNELVWLYNNALVFCLPSLYEGFGIPVIEAMACGCPVVVSNNSSLKEIAYDCAEFINPDDIVSISNGISNIINDEEKRNNLIKKGISRVKLFSWEKAAIKTLDNLIKLV
jgi:glycosyltransferase involved in cell wall biosynthesis